MSLISIENISAGYGKQKVIENISFEINTGELVGVLGVNGSGKSTLIKAMCGILSHDGDVYLRGESFKNMKTKELAGYVSYIPQHSGIEIDMSVLDVVLMGYNPKLKLLENPNKDMILHASTVVEWIGLKDKINANYRQLSEGQKQLVILARALVNDGRLIVMDEPESALDFSVRYKMISLVKQWIKEKSGAGFVSLHDTNLALNNCDRIILLKDKKIVGTIIPKNDTIEDMEEKLNRIYGNINLVRTKSKTGKENLIMIYNSEEV